MYKQLVAQMFLSFRSAARYEKGQQCAGVPPSMAGEVFSCPAKGVNYSQHSVYGMVHGEISVNYLVQWYSLSTVRYSWWIYLVHISGEYIWWIYLVNYIWHSGTITPVYNVHYNNILPAGEKKNWEQVKKLGAGETKLGAGEKKNGSRWKKTGSRGKKLGAGERKKS